MRTTNSRLSARELKQMLDRGEDVLVLNVLSSESFDQEHIPGSENVPGDSPHFVREVESLAGSKDRRIMVHCSSETCEASPRAARALEKAGFTNVRHFQGGMKEWNESGYNVERGETAASGMRH